MAYLYKRGNKWAYRVYAGKDPITRNDKQISKSGFRTKKDAELAAAIIERKLHTGEYIEPSKLTFSAICDDWLKHYLAQGAKDSSHRVRKKMLRHVNEALGDMLIQKIEKKTYQDMIDTLAEKFSLNTVISIHSSANMVFKYAHTNNIIKDVPSLDVKLPRKRRNMAELEQDNDINAKVLEKEELDEFLMVAKNEGLDGDLTTFAMLAYTGLRIGELMALKWNDIDFTKRTLRVFKTYYNPSQKKGIHLLTEPKTESSIRTILIDAALIDLLKAHKIEQEKTKKDNSLFYKDEDFIFADDEGYPRSLSFINRRIQRILKKTSIKKHITPHTFRHTHTSLLIEANVHIKEIQERLGHSDISITMNIYAHMTKNMKKEASDKFGNLMKDLSNNLL